MNDLFLISKIHESYFPKSDLHEHPLNILLSNAGEILKCVNRVIKLSLHCNKL